MEKIILKNLLYNEKYVRESIPFLKDDYFEQRELKILYTSILEFINKYNAQPTRETLRVSIDNNKLLSDDDAKNIDSLIVELEKEKEVKENPKWLIDETEAWIQERAIHLALLESINIIDDNKPKGGIPQILTDALAISFDSRVGHNYIDDAGARFDFYTKKEEKIPFGIEMLDKVTGGGVENKTLNMVLAGTGVGKTIFLCNYAANCLQVGKNVLYVTMEMSEEKIAERIDANLLNIALDDLPSIGKISFIEKINRLKTKTIGNLYIKEYPTSGGNVNLFRHLLDELKLKKKFVPDIIFIDYLNICSSVRVKPGGENSYGYIKSIAEELRGLAVEAGVPIFSATQTNKGGYNNTDIDLTNVAESMGLPHTADFFIALISTDELTESNQIMVKQLKSRYGDIAKFNKFLIGLDRSKMRFHDLENSTPVFGGGNQTSDQHGYSGKQLEEIQDDFFSDSTTGKKKTKSSSFNF